MQVGQPIKLKLTIQDSISNIKRNSSSHTIFTLDFTEVLLNVISVGKFHVEEDVNMERRILESIREFYRNVKGKEFNGELLSYRGTLPDDEYESKYKYF